jgi:hypothetical protein
MISRRSDAESHLALVPNRKKTGGNQSFQPIGYWNLAAIVNDNDLKQRGIFLLRQGVQALNQLGPTISNRNDYACRAQDMPFTPWLLNLILLIPALKVIA